MAAGVAAGVMTGAGLMWRLRPSPPVTSTVRSDLSVRPAEEVNAGGAVSSLVPTPGGSRTALTWTPDGQALVFVGRRAGVQQLYVRRLDAAEARPLAHTEGAQVPAVSADGQWMAFWAGGVIKKVPLGGGPAVDLAPADTVPPFGLVWDAHGGLLISRNDGRIWAIPVEGKPAPVTTVGDGELGHMMPSLLPGGRVLLYTVRKREWSWGDEEVVAQPLPAGARKVILRDAVDARCVPTTGHLLFLRRGVLFAVPFDAERLERLGTEAPVLGDVAQALTAGNGNDVTGAGQFAVSAMGALAWVPGPVVPYPDATLVAVDRRGQVTALPAPMRSYGSAVRLSPDQRRLAVTIKTLTEEGLWVYDLTRPAPLLPLRTEGDVMFPLWGPAGQELVFGWLKDGRRSLGMQPADGTAAPQALVSAPSAPSSVTTDGRIAAVATGAGTYDIVLVTVEKGKARVQSFIETPHTEGWPEFSPDGRWLLYASNVSDRFEVYVRPYPGPGDTEPVSFEGGVAPAWHPNGRELFFVRPPDPVGKPRMMVVEFVPGSPPRIGRPRVLFEFDPRELKITGTPVRNYDVAPDGQRFYVVQHRTPTPPTPVTHINLIQGWSEELKAKVPRQ